ncbi:MAG: hypothetical protein HY430_02870 [Candidatus Levybacteria bacterium]|nr:hypothetical protein [Candidatus Levybacteria bacterium]
MQSLKRKRISVTVCIAAIYNNNAILGASDRMLTGGYGDMTFEPPTPKILSITNSIAVMTAGDQNIQMQVFQEAGKIVREKIKEDPSKWLNVSDVAEIYSKCFYELRKKLIEKRILSQFNLSFDSFISKQKDMSAGFVDMITRNINRFDIDYMRDRGVETIITGIDDSGPHIYVVTNGDISCNDKLGFASIGIGGNHAISHFMLSAYSRFDSESKALLTIHQAKKKSEASPGVGKETDMCVIGPPVGTFTMLLPIPNGKNIVKDLDRFYKAYTQGIDRLNKKAEDDIKDYLSHLSPPASSKQEASSSASVSPSASPSSSPSPSPSASSSEKTKKGAKGTAVKKVSK